MFENKRLIIVVGALIIVGFAVEFLKGLDDIGPRQANRIEAGDLADIDSRSFVRSNRDGDKRMARNGRRKGGAFKLSGLPENMGKYDANDPKKGKGKATKKKKKKKKKKAKKKKSDKGPEIVVEVYGDDRERIQSPDPETISEPLGTFTPFDEDEESDISGQLADLQNRLLTRPDRAETIAFIRDYQSGKISPEDFYSIVDSMYSEEDEEFRDLAILSAGATPSLRSYNILATAFHDDASPNIRGQASTELRDYQSIQHLWIPRSVLASLDTQDQKSALLAANIINDASRNYLSNTTRDAASQEPVDPNTNPEEPADNTSGDEAHSANQARIQSFFQSLIPTLELAQIRFQQFPNVLGAIQSALSRIQQLEVVPEPATT